MASSKKSGPRDSDIESTADAFANFAFVKDQTQLTGNTEGEGKNTDASGGDNS